MMNSNKDTSLFDISILDLQKQEKEKERKKKQREKMREYLARPDVKERIKIKKLNEKMTREFKNLGKVDPHKICKKLGHTIAWGRRNPGYFYRCSGCDVSYSDKESEHFYKGNKCPCCHLILRTRKTIAQKKSLTQHSDLT